MISQCRLCGSNKLQLWMTDGRNCDLNYYRCSVCTLWNYDLSLGLDQSQYTDNYVSPTVTDFKHNVDITQSWKYIKKRLSTPGKVMDIGCGNACLLHLARQEGWQVQGMELAQSASDAIKDDQGIDVIVANFLEYKTGEPASFDLVVLRHVLEHLPDSILAMSQISSMLKVNGHALLEFPNTDSVAYAKKRWLKNRGLKNKKFAPEWRPGHCNEFCRSSFSFLLEKTNFELVDWQTYSSKPWLNPIYRLFPIASKARALVRKIR
ncbi:MAG: class I SAM-dependent methyltransferase [Nitrosomonadaceae bacterium]